MGFQRNTSAKSTTPTPASSAAATESGQTSARVQRELTRPLSDQAPKGQKIKTTKVVS